MVELANGIHSGPGPFHSNSKGRRLDPNDILSTNDKRIDFDRLEQLNGQSVVHAGQFARETIVELARFAALLELSEVASHHPLDGKLVITAFFEASTRTRLSFESAVLRLDGKVLSVPDGRTTGAAKGESLEDIGEMMNTYGDLVIMRHTETDAVSRIRTNLQLPLINAGNGSGEHPTQALVDWYALLKWRPALAASEVPESQRIHLGIVGTPGNMRAVKSFMRMALTFAAGISRITVVSEMADPLGAELTAWVAESDVTVEVTNDIADVLHSLDVVYMNSIALLGDSYKTLDSRYQIHAESNLKPEAVILHPMARRSELDVSLDGTPHNLYFAQAAGAVFIRQAILICLLGRVAAIPGGIRLLTQ